MLKKRLVPTPLVEPAERPPVLISSASSQLRSRRRHVIFGIVRWGISILWTRFRRRYDPASAASSLRALIEGFGGLWVKVGQLMSLRTDMLPKEFSEQLSLLQHRAVGFPSAVARDILDRELGAPVEQVFSEFHDVPFAAASISQVHWARLRHEGVEVAIKVQRPDIVAVFERDLALLHGVFGLLKLVNFMAFMCWDEMLWEVDQIMREEVDYRYEAANIRRARKSFRKHKVYVPKLYGDYCTRSVLVMEYISGTLMSDFIAMRNNDPARLQQWLDENAISPAKVGQRLLFAFLQELLEDNLFHGDLHPGNIILLRDSRFALIDLGSVGSLEKAGLELYAQSFRSIATRDYDKAVDIMFLLSPRLPPAIDLVEVKQKMLKAYAAWDARAQLRSIPYHEKSINSLGKDTTDILYKYEIPVSWAFMKVGRTWATLDASLNYLVPEANYTKLFKRFFVKAQSRGVKKALQPGTLIGGLSRGLETVTEFSNMLGPIVRRQALSFHGMTSKISFLWTTIFRFLKVATFVGTLVLLYDFLLNYKPRWVSGMHHQVLDGVATRIPFYDWKFGIVLFAGLVYVYRTLDRLRKRFAQHEVERSTK